MRTRHAIIVTLVFLLAGGSLIVAAGQKESGIHVKVPFAFHVGDDLMPAGAYRVAHFNSRDMLMITGLDGDTAHFVQGIPSGQGAEETAKLVFRRYGGTYFLWQVCIPGTSTNELRQSRDEKEYASRWNSPERTVVVATADQ